MINYNCIHTCHYYLLGTLDAVGQLNLTNFNDTSILLTWTAPFSLLPPDTQYCINVYTNGLPLQNYASEILSNCGIMEESYAFNYNYIPLNSCNRFIFEVLPTSPAGLGQISLIWDQGSHNDTGIVLVSKKHLYFKSTWPKYIFIIVMSKWAYKLVF